MFGGLGMQGRPNLYSVSHFFEGSFNEDGTGSVKAVFKVGFKFSASEERKKFDITASADWGLIRDRSGSDRLSDL